MTIENDINLFMFKETLAELRKKHGLSQNELARSSLISPDHIAKMEQGRRRPPKKKTLIKIINALNLNEEDKDRLISAAGYSSRNNEPLVLCSPFNNESLEFKIPDGHDISKLKNESLKIVAEILTDLELPIESRKEIEKMIISFAMWLRDNKKAEVYKKV